MKKEKIHDFERKLGINENIWSHKNKDYKPKIEKFIKP